MTPKEAVSRLLCIYPLFKAVDIFWLASLLHICPGQVSEKSWQKKAVYWPVNSYASKTPLYFSTEHL